MPGGSTCTFVESDYYESGLRHAQIELVILPRAEFKARLTRADLHDLQVLRCEENVPRVGYLHLTQRLSFVTFSAPSRPPPVWRGTELEADEIMFHSRGERLHQSTPEAFVWNVIAADPAQLEHYGQTLSGKPFTFPPEGQILRPPPRHMARLRRLHAQICRLAETRSKMLSHAEVARALEQGLIETLVACLTTATARTEGYANQHHARIKIKFEEILAEHSGRPLRMPELCELIGVSDRTLRVCCSEFIGVSPLRYVLLRRLKEIRGVLGDADPNRVSVAEVARHFGFTELGRFAGSYRATFGETPSATLQRTSGMRRAAL
jgi:AraC-like DNA-binding protein